MAWPKGKPRPPGVGRKKGVPNKATAAKVAAVSASGMTPLDFLLSVMRDVDNPLPVRIDAGKAAAPYVHPKLSSVDYQFKNLTDDELRAALGQQPAPAGDDAAGVGPAGSGCSPAPG